MGLLDFLRGLFSQSESKPARTYEPPRPPAPEVQDAARTAWNAALASGDYMAGQSAAYDLSEKAWLWDESVAAYRILFDRFANERGSIASMIGQTLYLGKAGYKNKLADAEKASVYFESLDWYVRATENGNRSQTLNYVEMCEWLYQQPQLRARLQPYLTSFAQYFPANEYQDRINALKS